MALLPAALAPHCSAGGERIWECRHEGRAFTLVLPERPRGDAILLLHGAGRTHRTLVENEETRAALLAAGVTIVMPNGGNSWWVDTVPLLGLMDWVQGPLAIERWSATGWSMGAYGSVRLVEKHPERFTAWAGIIGLLDFPNAGYPKEWNHSVPAVFGPAEAWGELNPMGAVERLRGKQVWFATGETAFDRKMNDAFQGRLKELGIEHRYEVIAGAHTFLVVARLLPLALQFLTRR
ncbi:MAG: hypothetical protein U0R19_18190 [Bryobacteraceae bacterium]